jgi:hypothetical protein
MSALSLDEFAQIWERRHLPCRQDVEILGNEVMRLREVVNWLQRRFNQASVLASELKEENESLRAYIQAHCPDHPPLRRG